MQAFNTYPPNEDVITTSVTDIVVAPDTTDYGLTLVGGLVRVIDPGLAGTVTVTLRGNDGSPWSITWLSINLLLVSAGARYRLPQVAEKRNSNGAIYADVTLSGLNILGPPSIGYHFAYDP